MLKSFFVLLIFLLGSGLSLCAHLLYPSWPLGLCLGVGQAISLLLMLRLSLVERLRFSLTTARDIWSVGGLILLATGLSLLFIPLNLESEATLQQFRLLATSPWGVLASCLLAPLLEEATFRAGVQQHLKRAGLSPWYAIVISALVFGIIHGNSMQALPAIILGIVLGWFYEKRGYTLAVLAHIVNNSLALLNLYYEEQLDFINYYPTLVLLCFGGLLTLLSITLLYRLLSKT